MTEKQLATEARTRVVFDFDPKSIDGLDRLGAAMGEPTRAGVVRMALRLLAFVVEARNAKAKIVMRRRDGSEAEMTIV